ncbi:MAG: hypothetical protein ACK5ME_10645 [Parahaliea sp.]
MTDSGFDLYGIFTDHIRQLESWEYADAKAAEEAWMQRKGISYPGTSKAGVSPLGQWHTWTRSLPELEQKYRDSHGDFKIIFEAVSECITWRLPVPVWCGVPLRWAYGRVEKFKVRSWDKAFDGPPHKGAKLSNRQVEYEKKIPVICEVLDSVATGRQVKESLEEVAKKNGFSFELVREWYYEHVKQFPVTECLMSDGWYYRKKTGEPDSAYKKHRHFTEPDAE